ncbi:hypothetical protein Tco_1373913, partial [Tanacetum coccineum]
MESLWTRPISWPIVSINTLSMSWEECNGEDTKFLEDTWLKEVVLKVQFSRVYALESQKDISVADKKRDNIVALSFRRSPKGWVEEEQFQLLRSRVHDTLLP